MGGWEYFIRSTHFRLCTVTIFVPSFLLKNDNCGGRCTSVVRMWLPRQEAASTVTLLGHCRISHELAQ